jgi:hypothetical protein
MFSTDGAATDGRELASTPSAPSLLGLRERARWPGAGRGKALEKWREPIERGHRFVLPDRGQGGEAGRRSPS